MPLLRAGTRVYVLAFLLMAACIGAMAWWAFHAWDRTFGPGFTVKETARILVHDSKFGMRAKEKAIRDGDDIVPLLRTESADFALLNGRNSFWIADVLGAIPTEASREVLRDLWGRKEPLAKLTGAAGLAQQGLFPEPVSEGAFVVETVRTDPGQAETQLAIVALGRTKDRKAVPFLRSVLEKRPLDYWHHAHACEALARIASADAIPILKDCLKCDQFHALPEAFRALVALRVRESVPLAIARIGPEIRGRNSGFVVNELERVTGQTFGISRSDWETWWKASGGGWEIPAAFQKPWDEQPHD